MKRILKLTVALWFGFLMLSVGVWLLPLSEARAQDTARTEAPAPATTEGTPLDNTGYLSGVLGVSTAGEGVGTGLGFGGDVAFFPRQYVGLGGFYRGGNHGAPSSSLAGAQVLLRPVLPFHLGFLLGAARLTNAGGGAAGNDSTTFLYGGRVGYDFPIGNTIFSLGPEVDFLFFKPAAVTVSHVNVLGSFKIWL